MIARKNLIAIVLSLVSALLFASTANAYLSDISISAWPGSLGQLEIGGNARHMNIGITAMGTSSENVQINYYLSESDYLSSFCGQRVHLKKVNINIAPGHNMNNIRYLYVPETHPNAYPDGNIYSDSPYKYILMVATVGPFDTNTLACDGNPSTDNYESFSAAKDIKAMPVTLTGGKRSCYENYIETGETQVQPNGDWFYHDANGMYTGNLSVDSGADLDLYLFKWEWGDWTLVSLSNSNSSYERINYTGSSGYYFWLVHSYDGNGSYELCVTLP